MKKGLGYSVLLPLLVWLGGCYSTSPAPSPSREIYFYHTVSQPGETLSSIAKWYTGAASNGGVLLKHNPGLDPYRIKMGEQVRIPKSWLVTTQPLPAVRIARPAPDAVGSAPRAVIGRFSGESPAAELPALEPAYEGGGSAPVPPNREVAENSRIVSDPQAAASSTAASAATPLPEAEESEKKRKIREQVLDDILQGN